jgi:hypothetical protein
LQAPPQAQPLELAQRTVNRKINSRAKGLPQPRLDAAIELVRSRRRGGRVQEICAGNM